MDAAPLALRARAWGNVAKLERFPSAHHQIENVEKELC